MEKDLTVIFLTVNKVPEKWAGYQKDVLLEATDGLPIITVSKKPLDWGLNILQTEPPSAVNIYNQMLRAAKIAETPYVAMAEDDTLYPYEHFHSFRPPDDTFGYNMIRWQLHTWQPIYYWRSRLANYAMIAPRKLLIEALEERIKRYPKGVPESKVGELGRNTVEKRLHVTLRKSWEFSTTIGLVCLHHEYGLDPLEQRHKKRMGMLRAYDIPHWGKSEDVVKHFI